MTDQFTAFDHEESGMKPEDSLDELKNLVDDYEEALAELEEIEEKLTHAKARVKKLGSEMIPEHLKKYGMSEIKLADKRKVTISSDLQLVVKNKEELNQYLIDTGAGELIKFNLSTKKLSDEVRKQLFDKMGELGIEYTSDNGVHHQTLKKHIKDILGTQMSEEQYARAVKDNEVVQLEAISQFIDVTHLNKTKIKK